MKPHSGPDHHTDHVLRHLLTTLHPWILMPVCPLETLEEPENILISKAGPKAGDGPDIDTSLYSSDDECL